MSVLRTSFGSRAAASALVTCLAGSVAVGLPGQGAAPAPPFVRLTEELRLDAEEHDFPAVTRVWVGPRGEIVVPIQQDMQLRMFDSTGLPVARVGRRGDGPGEFRWMGAFGWKADSMFVVDPQLRRVVEFAPDGRVQRTSTHWMPSRQPGATASAGSTLEERLTFFSPTGIAPDGTMLGGASLAPLPGMEREPFGEQVFVRVGADGNPRVLLTIPRSGDPRWSLAIDGFGFDLPFTRFPVWASSFRGDRVVHLWTAATSRTGGTFTVSAFRTTGDTLFVRTYPYVGVPIPQSAKDSALAAMLPRPGQPTEGPADLPQRRQAAARDRMPATYPGVEYLVVGLDATVWVALRATSEGTPVLALDGDTGIPLARILLPRGERLRQAMRTRAWVTRTDEDGIASVVRYRIDGIPRGR